MVCTNILGQTSVKHYYNTNINYPYSILMDLSRPSLGLSNVSVVTSERTFICSFTRDNSNENENYFNLFNGAKPYIVFAYGTGQISYHGINKYATPNQYIFQMGQNNNADLVKLHSIFYLIVCFKFICL